MAANDLGSSLTAISANAELLSLRRPADQGRELQDIRNNVRRAAELPSRLLSFTCQNSRIGSGADAIGDKAMSQGEEQYVKQMETIAARIALYNALKANPEIDAVLSPRYEFSYTVEDELADKELIVARKVTSVTARMRGKAIQVKNDEELYKTYTDYPELVRGPKQ